MAWRTLARRTIDMSALAAHILAQRASDHRDHAVGRGCTDSHYRTALSNQAAVHHSDHTRSQSGGGEGEGGRKWTFDEKLPIETKLPDSPEQTFQTVPPHFPENSECSAMKLYVVGNEDARGSSRAKHAKRLEETKVGKRDKVGRCRLSCTVLLGHRAVNERISTRRHRQLCPGPHENGHRSLLLTLAWRGSAGQDCAHCGTRVRFSTQSLTASLSSTNSHVDSLLFPHPSWTVPLPRRVQEPRIKIGPVAPGAFLCLIRRHGCHAQPCNPTLHSADDEIQVWPSIQLPVTPIHASVANNPARLRHAGHVRNSVLRLVSSQKCV